ncbi:hypothetical protein BD408DRAFT_92315 [Parasitella parasitica]|nr:hypothetical protein BD408DRAFT_92315 [Parasitella parasitica]
MIPLSIVCSITSESKQTCITQHTSSNYCIYIASAIIQGNHQSNYHKFHNKNTKISQTEKLLQWPKA